MVTDDWQLNPAHHHHLIGREWRTVAGDHHGTGLITHWAFNTSSNQGNSIQEFKSETPLFVPYLLPNQIDNQNRSTKHPLKLYGSDM